jgi:hypothetical protein
LPPHPQWTLVVIAYSYLASAFIGMAITRFKHRGAVQTAGIHQPDVERPRQRRPLAQDLQVDVVSGCVEADPCVGRAGTQVRPYNADAVQRITTGVP